MAPVPRRRCLVYILFGSRQSRCDTSREAMAAAALTDLWRAAQVFSLALKLDGSNHVLFSNRSAAHLALGHKDKALDDAEAALRLKPDWPKGFLRKGDALLGSGTLKGAHEAVEVYMQGVAVAEGKATDGIWSISGIVDI